jgi:hypothetical protein
MVINHTILKWVRVVRKMQRDTHEDAFFRVPGVFFFVQGCASALAVSSAGLTLG